MEHYRSLWERKLNPTLTDGSATYEESMERTSAISSRRLYLNCIIPSRIRSKVVNYAMIEVYKPPYEFQEVGWGEFEIQIQLHFNHPDMPFVEIPHMLRVFNM